jgi:hypothetical protein
MIHVPTQIQNIARFSAILIILFLAFYNLTEFPTTWFDEGSHLHVPKTFVRFGVYADYSSEGFRHYGPTQGLGPTVLLPIAAMFKIAGIGLLQARLVMVTYLLAAMIVFFLLARDLGGNLVAWIATALLITSRGVSLLEYGRQVLGEVPGLVFLVTALWLWFRGWEKASWNRLVLIGVLFGLSMITKYQNLIVVMMTLGLAWLLNLIYYRILPHRSYIVPGFVAAACFGLWQVFLILYPGLDTAAENFRLFREVSAGAALVFSSDLMIRSLQELLGLKVYLLALVPALVYGVRLGLPRTRAGQQWGTLGLLILLNLAWYIFASVSWLRYAFLGLAFSSLFVARFFTDLIHGIELDAIRQGHFSLKNVWRGVLAAWLAAMILIPLGQNVRDIIFPPFNDAAAMSNYLNSHVPRNVLLETWEPEMGFLTDHHYHFPAASFLPKAVAYIWLRQPPPSQTYDFVLTQSPPFILIGEFGRWVQMYPDELIQSRYSLITRIGAYELYEIKK